MNRLRKKGKKRGRREDIKCVNTNTSVPVKNVSPLQSLAGNIFDKFAKGSILVSGQVLRHKEGGGWVWYYEVDCVSEIHHPVGRVWL